MEKRLALNKYGNGKHLWTRDLARDVRGELNRLLDKSGSGDLVVIDATGVEVFDFSFANELFGKSALSLPNEYPDRFLLVENLEPYARENLIKGLESLGIAMIERINGNLNIIGKIHSAYSETFMMIAKAKEPVTASEIKDKMNINLTAANERLSKLTSLALVRRERGISGAGREQYIYSTLR
jgi:hypothetical protein